MKNWAVSKISSVRDGNAKQEQVQKKILKELNLEQKNLIVCKQIHGDKIAIVENNQMPVFEGFDGLVSDVPELVLGVFSADCLPVFLMEETKKIIGVFHSGWRGTVKKIVPQGIALVCKKWGVSSQTISIEIGPHIQDCCFEVGPEVVSQFSGKYVKNSKYVNLQKVIASQLMELGVPEKNILLSSDCTFCSSNFYSYRRNSTEERILCLISKLKNSALK